MVIRVSRHPLCLSHVFNMNFSWNSFIFDSSSFSSASWPAARSSEAVVHLPLVGYNWGWLVHPSEGRALSWIWHQAISLRAHLRRVNIKASSSRFHRMLYLIFSHSCVVHNSVELDFQSVLLDVCDYVLFHERGRVGLHGLSGHRCSLNLW